jgi:hypothetical protein
VAVSFEELGGRTCQKELDTWKSPVRVDLHSTYADVLE